MNNLLIIFLFLVIGVLGNVIGNKVIKNRRKRKAEYIRKQMLQRLAFVAYQEENRRLNAKMAFKELQEQLKGF